MQKWCLGEIEIHPEVCYCLMSGREEVRRRITCLSSTHYVFWRSPGGPATWVLRHTQRTWCWSIWLSHCPSCHFSGKTRPGTSNGVGSGHPELAPLACDLHCPKDPTFRKDPTSELPVYKWLIFLEQRGSTVLCPTLSFLTGFTNWIADPGLPFKC